jgi:hypothetical protein
MPNGNDVNGPSMPGGDRHRPTMLATLLVEKGRLDPRRCMLGFPHPSGANGYRPGSIPAADGELAAHVRA